MPTNIKRAGIEDEAINYDKVAAGMIINVEQFVLTYAQLLNAGANVWGLTPLLINYTPKHVDSKILVRVLAQCGGAVAGINTHWALYRNSSQMLLMGKMEHAITGHNYECVPVSGECLDTNAHTLAPILYQFHYQNTQAGESVYINRPDSETRVEHSTITIQEIKG